MQNIVKHAPNADSVSISAVAISLAANSELRFEVRDNGAGFPEARARSGSGFTNMRDRLAVVGGTLDVRSRVGAGTRVRGTIPL
jgi:signal transduction histidine kinase